MTGAEKFKRRVIMTRELTTKQRTVLRWFLKGLRPKEIAEKMHYSEIYIKKTLSICYKHFGVNRGVDLVRVCKEM